MSDEERMQGCSALIRLHYETSSRLSINSSERYFFPPPFFVLGRFYCGLFHLFLKIKMSLFDVINRSSGKFCDEL
jgi:hypothetical protein